MSLDDRTGDEWHFTALSDAKKALGFDLFKRLSGRFATGALAQRAQGKWYPGEILPRWAMNAFWRLDKQPLWLDADLLIDPEAPAHAPRWIRRAVFCALALALGLNDDLVVDAYEDIPITCGRSSASRWKARC